MCTSILSLIAVKCAENTGAVNEGYGALLSYVVEVFMIEKNQTRESRNPKGRTPGGRAADSRTKENVVLCGANSYEQKYYFNQDFAKLPEGIKQELQIMCVLFTEDVGGILTMEFTPEGELEFKVQVDEHDYLFDEIGSGLKIKQYQTEKRDFLEGLELFYKVFFLGADPSAFLDEEEAEKPGVEKLRIKEPGTEKLENEDPVR